MAANGTKETDVHNTIHVGEDGRPSASIPDGGAMAWLQCCGSFFLLFNSFGIINSYGAFQTFYRDQLIPERSDSEIAWIGSVQAFLNIFLGIIAGPIYDRGHMTSLIVCGTFASVLGLVMTGLCKRYYELILAQGVLVGTGAGLLFLPSIAILSQYFRNRLSIATGLASSGSAIGSICIPILFDRLQPVIGFRHALWIIALIALVTLVFATLTLRLRFKPEKIREIYDLQAFREAPFNLWSAYLFVSLLGLYIPSFYIQQFALTITDVHLAHYTLPILNAGSFFGRVVRLSSFRYLRVLSNMLIQYQNQIPLYLADRLGPMNVEMPATLCAGILALAWISVSNTGGLVAFSAIYGFFAGAVTTLTAPIDVALSTRLESVGVRMGMLLVPWSLGLPVSTPIAGAILGPQYDWKGLQIFCGSILLVATGLCVATRVTKYGTRSVRC